MLNEALRDKIQSIAADAVIEENKQFLMVTVPPGKLYDLIKTLKESEDTAFDYLFCLSGVDYGTDLGVVYHLESSRHHHQIVVKSRTPDRENPVLPSITDFYPGAEFLEDEVYDLLGIRFSGHPNLRRIFMWDEWKGYPLRKDYQDEVNIIEL